MKKIYCICVFVFLFLSVNAKDFDAQLVHVETALVYREDGKADISIKTKWNVSSGSFSSFYFSGEKSTIQFNPQKSWAEATTNNKKKRFPLECIPVTTGGYDIIISDGVFLSGLVDFVLSYRTNLALSEQTALVYKNEADDKEEKYFYFNWAPVAWELPFKSRTTNIILPISFSDFEKEYLEEHVHEENILLSSDEKKLAFFESLGLHIFPETLTVNTKIEPYLVSGIDQKSYFALRFVQENINPRESQPIRFYLNARSKILENTSMVKPHILMDKSDTVNFDAFISQNPVAKDVQKKTPWLFLTALLCLFSFLPFVFFFYLQKKKEAEKKERAEVLKMLTSSMKTKEEKKETNTNTDTEYKSFATLFHPIEVAFLLDLYIEDFLYIILEAMYLQKKIIFKKSDILKIKSNSINFDSYEQRFLSCFSKDGTASVEKLKDFFEEGIQNSYFQKNKQNREEIKHFWEKRLSNKTFYSDDTLKITNDEIAYWAMLSWYLLSKKEDCGFCSDLFFSPLYKQLLLLFQDENTSNY